MKMWVPLVSNKKKLFVDPDPDSMGYSDPDSNPGGQKTKEIEKKLINFIF
jgi:hypothetical protein